MRKPVFAAGVSVGIFLLLPQSKSQIGRDFVPAQAILTVEARHDHDKNIPSLRREDVMAYKRRERLQVTDLISFGGGGSSLELFLLVDDSSSTNLSSQFGDLRQFIEAQPEGTSIGIAYMQHGFVEIVQNLTADHSRAAKALRVPMWSGGTSPYLSLSDLIIRWPSTPVRREVVMVSSGVDSLESYYGPTNPYLDAAIADCQRNGIVVYTIYMPSEGHSGHSLFRLNWSQSHLAELADETGGEAYMLGFDAPVSLASYLDEIALHLRHQYRATFLMKPENKGGLRQVRFATEAPNTELVAAAKVYVPASGEQPRR